MNNFTALSYDQVIQKIKQHKPDIDPSIYLYQCLELDKIAPIFFFKSRVKRQTATKNGIEWRYANFCGWAASYDRKLNDFFRVGYQPSANDTLTVSFDRLFLVHAERRFDWETPQTPDEELEVKLYPPLPWHLADNSEKFSISRTNICFWVTDASELNQIDATPTDTATVNEDDLTTQREPIYKQPDAQLLAILDTNHPDHAPDLAIAVKLWLDLYGRDEKTKHSHSHGADLFLGKEQLQSTAKERIKEITSPIKNWNKQRLGAYNNAKK